MAKKTIESQTPKKAYLIKSKEDFKQELEERINLGKELYAEDIPSQQRRFNRYGSMGYVPPREELSEKQQNYISRFRKWSDYNTELLKQSFDHSKNEYETVYKNTGIALIITGDEDLIKEYRNELKRKTEYLESLVEKIPLLPMDDTMTARQPIQIKDVQIKSNNIFIVHGHDGEMKHHVARVLQKLGLNPIILHEQPDESRTIIEKLEYYGNKASYAVVLLTADDAFIQVTKTSDGNNEQIEVKRARQNVVFEMGFFMAKYGRNHVFLIRDSDAEKVGDIDGVIYSETNSQIWIMKLTRELQNAGYTVDANKALYLV